ncbi:hypothetical protein V6Z11_A05G379400 [Gossypium hirsutum]
MNKKENGTLELTGITRISWMGMFHCFGEMVGSNLQ